MSPPSALYDPPLPPAVICSTMRIAREETLVESVLPIITRRSSPRSYSNSTFGSMRSICAATNCAFDCGAIVCCSYPLNLLTQKLNKPKILRRSSSGTALCSTAALLFRQQPPYLRRHPALPPHSSLFPALLCCWLRGPWTTAKRFSRLPAKSSWASSSLESSFQPDPSFLGLPPDSPSSNRNRLCRPAWSSQSTAAP